MADLQSVQSVPQGLLELLSMKGSGVNPKTLDSVVSPSIDVRQMYALSRLSSPFASAVGGVGTEARVTVPANEWWILLSCNGVINTNGAATTYISGTLQVSFGTALLPVHFNYLNLGDNSALPSNTSLSLTFVAPYPMILRPGGSVAARNVDRIGGTTADVLLQVNIGVLS